jgi:chromosome segregation ATPase
MKENLKFTLLVIGIVVVFFIMGREIIETRTKLRKTQDEVAQEKKEKTWLQDELKTTRGELADTNRNLRTCQGKLGFVNKKIFLLRDRNAALSSSNATLIIARQGLEHKIITLQEEKRIVEARIHSLSELKKAIRQVKIEMREDRIKQRKERIRQQEETDKWETARGNQGFLTKNGEHLYKPKVNVDVRPANVSLNKK